jgi:hypothetical protein
MKPGNPIPAPNPLARELLRYVRWFGVGVALGLAPFLGALPIPGFSPLLDIYPLQMRGWLLPLSGILMGGVAVRIDFLSLRLPSRASLRRSFLWSLGIWLAAFVALVLLYPYLVARVSIGDGTRFAAVVTGTDMVPRHPPDSPCKCPESQSAERCAGNIGLEESRVRECFGSRRVTRGNQALAVLYLLVTGSFVAAVGFHLLSRMKEEELAKKAPPRKGPAPSVEPEMIQGPAPGPGDGQSG